MSINTSFNTGNGKTAENQEERLFSMRQHFYFGATLCENLKVQTCFGAGNLYKDLFSIYLQPSVNQNS